MRLWRFFLAFIAVLPLRAQQTSSMGGRLTIRTDPPASEVYLDSVMIGVSPLLGVPVSSGSHRLSLFYPSSLEWNSLVRRDSLVVRDNEEIQKSLEFGTLVSLASFPSGSKVLSQGRELGTTPIFFRSTSKMSGDLVLEKERFERTVIPLSGGMASAFVRLRQANSGNGGPPAEVVVGDLNANGSRLWVTYASAAGMVGSGIVAAYFKERANKRFDLYVKTRNPSYLASTQRNDRRSAVAFAFTQVGFALLTYFLLSE